MTSIQNSPFDMYRQPVAQTPIRRDDLDNSTVILRVTQKPTAAGEGGREDRRDEEAREAKEARRNGGHCVPSAYF